MNQSRTTFVPRHSVELKGPWNFSYSLSAPSGDFASLNELISAGYPIYEAHVPGNLELDLQRLGILPDPFFGLNILKLRELENAHVWYQCQFKAPAPQDKIVKLVFEGIDCFATIYLNGLLLGQTDNMLVEHDFDVSDKLQPENELFIHITPANHRAASHNYPPGLGAPAIHYESLFVRKAPHQYGWDIMPRALSAGIWRPVKLHYLPKEHIESLFLVTNDLASDNSCAHVTLAYEIAIQQNALSRYRMEIEGTCDDHTFRESIPIFFRAGKHRFSISAPRLWWPNGYGAPHIYQVRASLWKENTLLDTKEFNFGIRTVCLHKTNVTDKEGSGDFSIYINGQRIFAKGTNWVPLDVFHARDESRTEQAIRLAKNCHCNIIRCWGGNVYESERFFDLCDSNGLMVWQDFAMACMVYPQDTSFQEMLAREAKKVVRRLRQHPSVVLWAGDNECDLAYAWNKLGNPNDNVLTRKTLPDILRQEDPTRPFLPSSPYVSDEAYLVGEEYLPENHLWGPRDYYKSTYYKTSLCHFASEIGYHGCPAPESIRQFISPENIWPYKDNPEWNLHSTNPAPDLTVFFSPPSYRVELMANQVQAVFGKIPDDLETFAFASQVVQAEAMKTFIEMFRSNKWRRTGIIWWNLLDGWPQFSDAVIDYYFREKLAYSYIQRSQRHLCLMIREPVISNLQLVAANDTLEDIPLAFTVKDVETGKQILAGEAIALANATTPLGEFPHHPTIQRFYLIEWQSPAEKGVNHYLAGEPPFTVDDYKRWLEESGLTVSHVNAET